MCPASEIERRLRIEDIALFERMDPRVASTNTALAVKKFARNVRDSLQGQGLCLHRTARNTFPLRALQIEQRPENFRTMAALQRTMAHLRRIMDATDVSLVNIHKFLWDRFRGVRQDLFVQGFEARLTTHPCCLIGGSPVSLMLLLPAGRGGGAHVRGAHPLHDPGGARAVRGDHGGRRPGGLQQPPQPGADQQGSWVSRCTR
jgi:hypothetical protein